jgi:hypothetical protein
MALDGTAGGLAGGSSSGIKSSEFQGIDFKDSFKPILEIESLECFSRGRAVGRVLENYRSSAK